MILLQGRGQAVAGLFYLCDIINQFIFNFGSILICFINRLGSFMPNLVL